MKNCLKFICLAQTASDSGKGYISAPENGSANKAIKAGYELKDEYITQAINLALKEGNIEIGISYDYNFNMNVVLFNIKGFGQVSFHSFKNYGKKYPFLKNKVEWNGIRGGSLRTCSKIAKKYNWSFYNHG